MILLFMDFIVISFLKENFMVLKMSLRGGGRLLFG